MIHVSFFRLSFLIPFLVLVRLFLFLLLLFILFFCFRFAFVSFFFLLSFYYLVMRCACQFPFGFSYSLLLLTAFSLYFSPLSSLHLLHPPLPFLVVSFSFFFSFARAVFFLLYFCSFSPMFRDPFPAFHCSFSFLCVPLLSRFPFSCLVFLLLAFPPCCLFQSLFSSSSFFLFFCFPFPNQTSP